VGDDAWIGDVNVANTIWVKGITLPGQGYVGFGSDSNKLGYTGSFLAYSGMVKFGPGSHPEVPGNYQPFVFDVTNAGGWGNISIVNNVSSYTAGITLKTLSNTNSSWNIQKRDDGLYGTSVGCFSIEDSTASIAIPRWPLTIVPGDSGNILLNRNVDVYTGKKISVTKDVTPSSSSNTNYLNAPIVINRASTSGTTAVAGLGFHNAGVNGALLYYDPTMSQFRYNNDIGDINTIPSVLTSYGGNLDMGTFNTTTGGTYDVYTIPANVYYNNNGGRLRLVLRGYTGNNWECKLKIGGQQLFRIDANYAESMIIECSIGGGATGSVMGTVTAGYWNNVDSASSGLSRNYNLCATGIDFSANILIQLEIKGVDYPIGVYLNHLLVQKY